MNSLSKMISEKGVKEAIGIGLFVALLAPMITSFWYSGSDTIVKVNSQSIGLSEFKRNYFRNYEIKEHVKKEYGDMADLILQYYGLSGDIEQITVDALVKEKLFQDLAVKLGIEVGPKFLEEKLSDIMFSVKANRPDLIPNEAIRPNNTVDVSYLNQHLRRMGISHEDFEKEIKDVLRKELVLKLINQSIIIPEIAIKELFIQKYTPRSYNFFKLNFDNYLSKVKNENLFDKDIEDYYKAHLDEFKTLEERSASVWEFDSNSFDINVEDKEIQAYYDANKKDFLKEKNNKEAAKEIYKSIEEVKVEIEKILKQKEFIRLFGLQATELFNDSKEVSEQDNLQSKDQNNTENGVIEPDKDIKDFISNNSGKLEEVNNIIHDGSIRSNKIFNINKLEDYTYWTSQDKGYIAKLNNIKDSEVKDLKEVEDQIKEILYNQKAKDTLSNDIKKAYRELFESLLEDKNINKNKFSEMASELGIQIESLKINPKESKEVNNLRDKGLPINDFLNMTVKDSLYYIIDKDGYLIFLEQVDDIDLEEFKSKKEELFTELKSKFDNVVSNAYLAYLQKNAKIEYIGLTRQN